MAQRRKRKRTTGARAATPPASGETDAPGDTSGDALDTVTPAAAGGPSRYERSRERDAQVREGLEPLAPGERPGAVTAAAILALVLAGANVAAALSGRDLGSDDSGAVQVTVISTAILVLAAGGMLANRYWAVLGFQVILGLQVTVLSLALLRVEKWWVAVGVVVLIGGFGYLFWKLVRAMARLQMPQRRSP